MDRPIVERLVPSRIKSQMLLSDSTAYVIGSPPIIPLGRNIFIGKWFTFLPKGDPDEKGLTTLDKAWFKVLDAVEEDRNLFRTVMVSTAATPSKCILPEIVQEHDEGVLMCFTNDLRDTFDVKRAGSVLRGILAAELTDKKLFYFYGFTEHCGRSKCLNRCGSDSLLYVQNKDGAYSLRNSEEKVKHKPALIVERQRLIPTRVTNVEWLRGDEAYQGITEVSSVAVFLGNTVDEWSSGKWSAVFEKNISVSEVQRLKDEHASNSEVEENGRLEKIQDNFEDEGSSNQDKPTSCEKDSEEFSTFGSWMVFLPKCDRDADGLTTLDKAWFKILDACEKDIEIFHSTMVSTSMAKNLCQSPSAERDKEGAIICLTDDFHNLRDVRRAAAALRKILQDELDSVIIYYKTSNAANALHYECLGVKGISTYRHCPDGSFWKRVDVYSWERLVMGRMTVKKRIPSQVAKETFFGEDTAFAEEEEEFDFTSSNLDGSVDGVIQRWVEDWGIREKELDAQKHLDLGSFGGYWTVYLSMQRKNENRLTHLDQGWFKVLEHQQRGSSRFTSILVSTTRLMVFFHGERLGIVCCSTSDYRDKLEVRRAAEELRVVLGDLDVKDLHYFYNGAPMYKHAPDGTFWMRLEDKTWHRIITGNTTMKKQIPSQVMSQPFIDLNLAFAPFEDCVDNYEHPELQRGVEGLDQRVSNEEAQKYLIQSRFSGYWKAYLSLDKMNDERLTNLDQGWFKLLEHQQQDSTKFLSILVSTNQLFVSYEGERFGIIYCSTKDYRDMAEVRRAAGHLRDVLGDLVLNDKIYYHARDYHMYKHDPDWSFWMQMEDETWERKIVSIQD